MPLHELAVAREDAISLAHVIRSHRKHDHEVRLSHVRHMLSPCRARVIARAAIIRPGAGSAAPGIRQPDSTTPRAGTALKVQAADWIDAHAVWRRGPDVHDAHVRAGATRQALHPCIRVW